MSRTLSHLEIASVSSCEAKHAFSYTGALTDGTVLKPKTVAPKLREGRAWGRAVAAYHANVLATDAVAQAFTALSVALSEDAAEQKEAGVYDGVEHGVLSVRLEELLEHYIATTDPLVVERLEHEIEVPLRSRVSGRASNRYRFLAYIDAIHRDDDGRFWLVEYKLRGQLTSFAQIALGRQVRRYAWAWRAQTGIEPAGVIVDERLAEMPKPARVVKAKRKGEGIDGMVPSHAVDQVTTPELYRGVCADYGVEPHEDTLTALGQRRWQLREPVVFRPGEIDEAGEELVSAAQLVRDLDSGVRHPIRNPSQPNCGGCFFREICPAPDPDLIDALFVRKPPKRDRVAEAVVA